MNTSIFSNQSRLKKKSVKMRNGDIKLWVAVLFKVQLTFSSVSLVKNFPLNCENYETK